MGSTDDAWEAVFALAGSVNESSESLSQPAKGGSSLREQKKKRRKCPTSSDNGTERPAGTALASSVNDDAVFQAYLIQRTSNKVEWPSWMSLQEGFNPRRCSRWLNLKGASDGAGPVASSRCSTCHQSPLRHVSRAAKSRFDCPTDPSLSPTQDFFLALRNLRCVAVLLALHVANGEPYDVPLTAVDRLGEEWKHSITRMHKSFTSIPESFRLACQQVNPRTLKRTPSQVILEPLVKLIISIDNVYFRLYYSLLSRELPFDAVLPHPVSYFGLVAVDMDCYTRLARKLPIGSSGSAHPNSNEKTNRLLFGRFGVTDKCGSFGFEHANLPQSTSALSVLHRLRFLETIALLQTWSAQVSTRRQLAASCRSVRDRHETPAPEILMRWRDSCRDFLCHLYCYATLPPATLEKLRLVLVQRKVNNVLELGAGTGYLAYLLRELLSDDGISMEAVDLHPTSLSGSAAPSSSNEYHGSTPPFFDVKAGSESVIKDRLLDRSQTALLMCYPPPESSLAFDATRQFMSSNGEVIIFIGEFKGLTGSSRFERLLQREFACVARLPCLCWGTDASTLTIWAVGPPTKTGVSLSLLLPCSFCGDAESVKRCRLLRCISYCSRRCFERHAFHREKVLKLVMVDVGGISGLDFDSSHHFSDLGVV